MSIGPIVSGAASDDEALAAIVSHFRADSGTIHLMGGDGLLHLAAATPGFPQPVLDRIRVIPVGKGMAGLAVERGKPVDACNIQSDTSGDVRPGALATGLAGAVVVPIFAGDDAVGALGVANRGPRSFEAAEIEELLEAGRAIAAKHATSRRAGE